MRITYKIPREMRAEFQTVTLLLGSKCETRVVDALIISCAKYEKQLRRIFVHLSRQRFDLTLAELQNQIASNKWLYPHNFIAGIERLSNHRISELIGEDYPELRDKVEKLLVVRNKVIHGQLTGMQLTRKALLSHINGVVEWVSALAKSSRDELGFDGIARKYPRLDKKNSVNPESLGASIEFRKLLMTLSKLDRRGENLSVGNAPNSPARALNEHG